jgi:hypothetical protein
VVAFCRNTLRIPIIVAKDEFEHFNFRVEGAIVLNDFVDYFESFRSALRITVCFTYAWNRYVLLLRYTAFAWIVLLVVFGKPFSVDVAKQLTFTITHSFDNLTQHPHSNTSADTVSINVSRFDAESELCALNNSLRVCF